MENLVGEENKGWDYAKFLLGNERTGIARVGVSKERIRRIKELASKVESGGKPIMQDQKFREKLAEVEVAEWSGLWEEPEPQLLEDEDAGEEIAIPALDVGNWATDNLLVNLIAEKSESRDATRLDWS